jgi:hypothetical protein
MELLAILSTIILVGTVATLILAVASYVLYKARERRSAAVNQNRPTAPRMQHHVLTVPVNGYPARSLPEGGEQPIRFHESDGAAAPPEHMTPRPAQAATYVPPDHLRLDSATRPETWEYGVEAFVPLRRKSNLTGSSARSHGDDLIWLG